MPEITVQPYRSDATAPQAFDPGNYFVDRNENQSAAPSFDPGTLFVDKGPDSGKESPKAFPQISPVGSAVEGALSGLSLGTAPAIAGVRAAGMSTLPSDVQEAIKTHGHEPVLGALIAGLGRLGYENLIAPALGLQTSKEGTAAYKQTRDVSEEERVAAEKQNPAIYVAGQLGGALLSPLGAVAAPIKGASIGANIARGSAVGTVGGGLYGGGEAISRGETPVDVATETGKGAATGAAFGTIGSAAANIIGKGVSKVAGILRGATYPDAEAARRVIDAWRSDYERTGPKFIPEQAAVSNKSSVPVSIMDVGGERTRALLRSAANTSPEARAAIEEVTTPRFEEQGTRIASLIRQGAGSASDDLWALKQAARAANKPAYARAYAAGDRDIWSPELERLTNAPSVSSALKNAQSSWKDWQAVDGFGGSIPPVRPNIQFWDYAARDLADKSSQAFRQGNDQLGARYSGLERQLKEELDRIVPEYGDARKLAKGFFGGKDALEAGQEFVMSGSNIGDAARALGKMNSSERELFSRGFASSLADKIEKVGYDRDVLKSVFVNNTPARQKILMALGPQRAREIESLLRVESIVDQARKALGNSTTARQLIEHGLAGGGAIAAFEGLKEHEFNPSHILAAALTVGAAKHGAKLIDSKVASKVGEFLASNDPSILAKGLKTVTASPVYFSALRRASDAGIRVGTQDIGPGNAAAAGATLLHRAIVGPQEEPHHAGQDATVYDNLVPQQ